MLNFKTKILTLTVAMALAASVIAQDTKKQEPAVTLEVVEKLGDMVPLEATLIDKDGQTRILKDLISKPTVLVLVYYRCPSICSPLLQEMASVVDQCQNRPGSDYNLLTVSFDPRETPKLSTIAQDTIVGSLEKEIPVDSWQFLTGTEENITKLAQSVGFGYIKDKEDYIHKAAVMFLSKEGKICRYLHGLRILPAEMDMAIIDAKTGTVRSVIPKPAPICAPERLTRYNKVNKIVLAISVLIALGFIIFLIKGKPASARTQKSDRKT